MQAVYRDLPAATKQRINGLRCIHPSYPELVSVGVQRDLKVLPDDVREKGVGASVGRAQSEHRRADALSLGSARCENPRHGRGDSLKLLTELWDIVEASPHRWRSLVRGNDILIWDNIGTVHDRPPFSGARAAQDLVRQSRPGRAATGFRGLISAQLLRHFRKSHAHFVRDKFIALKTIRKSYAHGASPEQFPLAARALAARGARRSLRDQALSARAGHAGAEGAARRASARQVAGDHRQRQHHRRVRRDHRVHRRDVRQWPADPAAEDRGAPALHLLAALCRRLGDDAAAAEARLHDAAAPLAGADAAGDEGDVRSS